jgi:hypothetical protein
VELTMTSNDPITGLLDRIAAYREQITRLDTREAEHHTAVSGQLAELTDQAASIGRTLHGHAAVLAELTAASQAARNLTATARGQRRRGGSWQPTAGRSRSPGCGPGSSRFYRPGYGHLAAALGPCWDQHDLCLYGLDIAAELWSVLYLQPGRSPGLVSAQAEYQARILPALADQLRIETNRCGHPRDPAPVNGQPWSRP